MATAAVLRFEEEQETCRLDAHAKQLLSRLSHFWTHESFCDLTLVVEDVKFKVHRVILAGCSDYFEAMFSHNMVERRMEEVTIPSVSLKGFRPLLSYIYSGELHLTIGNIYDIIPVASFLQMTSALKLISSFLKNRLTFENAEQLVSMCDSHGLNEVQKFYRAKILNEFMTFAETEQFLELDAMTLSGLLCEDGLRCPDEMALLQVVLCWYNCDREARDEHMAEILDKIRYTQDGWDTIEFAQQQKPFTTNRQCREILVWCRHYMQDPNTKHLKQSHRTRVRYDEQTLVQMGGMHLQRAQPFMDFEYSHEFEPRSDEKTGYNKNQYYHIELNRWMPMGPIEHADARSHNPLVAVNGFVIMVGGYIYTTDFSLSTYQHCTDEVKLLDPGAFALWDLCYMAEARANHAVVYMGGFVYAIGGKSEGGVVRSVERYSLEEDDWTHVQSLPEVLYDHAAAPYNNEVYVSGGIMKGDPTKRVLAYNPQFDQWVTKPSLLTARSAHAMAEVGGRLVVCGGYTGSRCLASVECFCPDTQQWMHLTPMRQDCCHITAVVLEGDLLIVGGENSVGDLLTLVQQYSPCDDAWSTFTTLPTAMKNVGCCAVTVKPRDTSIDEPQGYLTQLNDDEEPSDADDYDDDDDNDDNNPGDDEPTDDLSDLAQWKTSDWVHC